MHNVCICIHKRSHTQQVCVRVFKHPVGCMHSGVRLNACLCWRVYMLDCVLACMCTCWLVNTCWHVYILRVYVFVLACTHIDMYTC